MYVVCTLSYKIKAKLRDFQTIKLRRPTGTALWWTFY